jgi:hypothetical protein
VRRWSVSVERRLVSADGASSSSLHHVKTQNHQTKQKTHESLHPSPVVSPIPPRKSFPSRWRFRRLGVSRSSFMMPDLAVVGVGAGADADATLLRRLSTLLWGVAPLCRPGRSLELGDRKPLRTIRSLGKFDLSFFLWDGGGERTEGACVNLNSNPNRSRPRSDPISSRASHPRQDPHPRRHARQRKTYPPRRLHPSDKQATTRTPLTDSHSPSSASPCPPRTASSPQAGASQNGTRRWSRTRTCVCADGEFWRGWR